MATSDWTAEVPDQIETHWQERLRPRLEGMTDEEFSAFADASAPVARAVLYVSVEAFHHGAEVCLLRDLFLKSNGPSQDPRCPRAADEPRPPRHAADRAVVPTCVRVGLTWNR